MGPHYFTAMDIATLTFVFVITAVSLSPPSLVYAALNPAPPCQFPAIFNFGDSNSDTGGAASAFFPVSPPAGETFFHAPAGRFSDGRLIIDFIAESLGLPYVSAYLDSIGSNFTHGANFAVGGATIMAPNSSATFDPVILPVQAYQFYNFQLRSSILENKGHLPLKEYFAQGLYMLDIGQNDLKAYLLDLPSDQVQKALREMLDQFKTVVVQNVYNLGGRFFWVHNTGPLGCLPFVLSSFSAAAGNSSQLDQAGCAIPWNNLAQQFNTLLKQVVAELRAELPDAKFTYVDIHSAKYELISHASQYGFEEPLRACCGYGGGKYNFDETVHCGQPVAQSCEKPSAAVSWDGIHYTEAANQWVFSRIVNGSYSDPSVPLNMAC